MAPSDKYISVNRKLRPEYVYVCMHISCRGWVKTPCVLRPVLTSDRRRLLDVSMTRLHSRTERLCFHKKTQSNANIQGLPPRYCAISHAKFCHCTARGAACTVQRVAYRIIRTVKPCMCHYGMDSKGAREIRKYIYRTQTNNHITIR